MWKNPVCKNHGRTLKTCLSCFTKLKEYRNRNFQKKERESQRVICTTCNTKPAMIRGRKQYHTCNECRNRKKIAYYEKKEKNRKAIDFYNLGMKYYDDLPQEMKEII